MKCFDDRLFSKSIKEVNELKTLYNKDLIEVTERIKKWHGNLLHPSTKCYVIGNGLSRKNLNLHNITRLYVNTTVPKKSFVIGCNYIYKEFKVDLIVAQDTKVLFQMAKDNVEIPVVAPLLKYNWAKHSGNKTIKNFYPLRFPSFNMTRWNSGDIALYTACILGFKKIEYIGFDGGESSIYRENDGVSFVRQVETQRRIKMILNSFETVKINRYEDKLKKQSPSV
ncbi:hypothetical protein [uncultured Mediterranean phage]|nr:hypothetical protein [uncultured Mediterranean phage]